MHARAAGAGRGRRARPGPSSATATGRADPAGPRRRAVPVRGGARWPAASCSRPTPSSATPTCRSRTAPLLPGAAGAAPAPRRGRYSPSLRSSWHRSASAAQPPAGAAHHNIHFGGDWDGRSGRSSTTAGGCPIRRSWSPCPRSTTRRWLPPGATSSTSSSPCPTSTARSTGRASGSGSRAELRGRVGAARLPGRRRGRARRRPAGLGARTGWSGARRSRSPTASSRPARSGPRNVDRRVPRASCSPAPAPCPASACRWCWCRAGWPPSGSTHAGTGDERDPVTTRCRDASTTALRARCRSRHTARHGTTYYWADARAARRGQAAPRVRALRRSAATPTTSSTTSAPAAGDAARGADGARRRRSATGFFADLDAGPLATTRCSRRVVHTVQRFDIDPDCFRRFLRSMTMDLDRRDLRDVGRPARLHGRLGRGDRRDDAADPRAASTRRRSQPGARPRRSRSSSRTSCATSARTSTAAACTSPRRTCAGSAPTRARRRVDAGVAWR